MKLRIYPYKEIAINSAFLEIPAESHAFLAATEAAGLQLGTDHVRASHKIICVSTALKEFQQYGPDIYTEGLRAITEAWEGDPDSLRAGIIQGVMRFIALYKDE